MLENYHAAVVRAHKEHSGVEVVIPVPVPPMPGDGRAELPAATRPAMAPPRPDA
jgi:hypothetical protein